MGGSIQPHAAQGLTWAIVSPVRNERENVLRMADRLRRQTVRPTRWVLVDNGSTDGTQRIGRELAGHEEWISLLEIGADAAGLRGRGAPIVRAFHRGLGELPPHLFAVAKLDVDVSFYPDYFERLLRALVADESLGIVCGTRYEFDGGAWTPLFGTGPSVSGAARMYRWSCLREILPLEERMGWDGIDLIKANLHGRRTLALADVPFFHHREEASREPSRWQAWAAQGDASYYMGYRPSYQVMRTLYWLAREPASLGMLWSYALGFLRGDPRCPDAEVRAHVRREQRLRSLRTRARERSGRTPDRAAAATAVAPPQEV